MDYRKIAELVRTDQQVRNALLNDDTFHHCIEVISEPRTSTKDYIYLLMQTCYMLKQTQNEYAKLVALKPMPHIIEEDKTTYEILKRTLERMNALTIENESLKSQLRGL